MANLEDMLKGVDSKTLNKGVESAKKFVNTPEGKSMIEKFKGNLPNDKEGLLKLLAENPDIIKSLEKYLNL